MPSMIYFVLGAGVWLIGALLQNVIEAPRWFWLLVYVVIGIPTFGLAISWDTWYIGVGIAGLAALVDRVDGLLMVKEDESIKNITRR